MSRPDRTRAAFGAALVGVLLALVAGITGAVPQAASNERVPASSSAPSLEGATSQLGHAVLRTSHAAVASVVGVDRTSGHGASAGALLLLALVCLAIGVRRARALRRSAVVGARACRAPPAAVLV